jgi:hypothetical protein
MSVGRGKLDEKRELAISALLTERTHVLAAAKAGVSPATLTRWLAQPDFRLAYRQARRAVVEGTIASLQRAGTEAAETLQASLSCADDAIRVRAAALILEHGFRGLEVLDLAERVEELETLLVEVRSGKVFDPDDAAGEDAGGGEDTPGEGDPAPGGGEGGQGDL